MTRIILGWHSFRYIVQGGKLPGVVSDHLGLVLQRELVVVLVRDAGQNGSVLVHPLDRTRLDDAERAPGRSEDAVVGGVEVGEEGHVVVREDLLAALQGRAVEAPVRLEQRSE